MSRPRSIHPITLPVFRQRLDTIYAAAGRAPKTRQQLDHAIRIMEASGARTTADLTTHAVAKVILDRGPEANPHTTRGLISRLRRACNLAKKAKLLDEPPDWSALWPRASRPKRPYVQSSESMGRFLASIASRLDDWYDHRLCALGWLVAMTGIRRNEALFARVEDLDLAKGFIFVLPADRSPLKTERSAAPVPLPDSLVPVLEPWLLRCGPDWLFPGARREGPWTGGSPGYRPNDRLRQAGDAAGVPHISFRGLRHSLATNLLRDGTPEWAIQRILRHTTPMTTEHYLHPTDHDVARHVRGFAYPVGAGEPVGLTA